MIEIIAEVGQAHDGSLGILHSYIDAIASTGVDTIKFQTHIASAESSTEEPFRINFSYEDKTRYDYWKRMEFTVEQWMGIKEHCESLDVAFLSSPFSCEAVDLLFTLGVKRFKIGSGEVNNYLMLDYLARRNASLILSSGLSSFEELDKTVARLRKACHSLSLLQCTTKYPTEPEDIGLNVISEMYDRYSLPVGLSDHSGNIYASLAAVALGARKIEVHVTFDKRLFGPDSSSSLTINQLQQLVEGIRHIERMMINPVEKKEIRNDGVKDMFGKSISLRTSLPKGAILKVEHLESKKPVGQGISATMYESIIGKKLKTDKNCFDFLNWGDLYD